MAPLPLGLHYGIADDTYHADPAPVPSLSSTLARLILDRSPLHAWWAHPRLNPDFEPVERKTFDIGRAAHRAVLGAGSDYVAIPHEILASNGAASTKAAKEFIEQARASGLTPLKAAEVDQIGEMRVKVHQRLDEMGIVLDSACSEAVVLADISGTTCRVMIDNAPRDPAQALYDFKTTTDASPEHCTRAVMNYGYDVQAAFYLDAWKATTGEDRAFRFIFQEKEAPFEVCIVELSGDDLDIARKKTRRAREIWQQCLTSGRWPGYPAGVHRIELPGWFTERWLERESAESDFRRRHGHDVLDQARRWQAPLNIAAE
ncbi:PD-(D/E)XK nuclease-like domain-containing protein [Salipiger marinus]|uniref:PD-(D/E)XK nuclease-like domain-containing protein n=1 Tax=Salipiger marinus TaxID=555512 RepID=UPI002D1870D9|nr:PD-(D/E)XK nuclease-like domain-containing protein [Salipiger manganoxidans]MEB3419941.1 PD-(D/E)XK nuclease-like domain-containing protein [Salipiger manganoxidans]